VKRYVIPIVAGLLIIGGLVFITIPFIPLGWLFLILAALVLVPYFTCCRNIFSILVKKDRTGLLAKASRRVVNLYKWAGDNKNARRIEKVIEETLKDNDLSKGSTMRVVREG